MYYPKSKILENQYTSGNEYIIKSTGKPYQGYYYALSNNTYFSGKTPNSMNQEELVKSTKKQINITNPNPFYPVPSDKDYQLGFIPRYFIKKRNENYTTIQEISPDDFSNFDDSQSIYVTTKINWKITGTNVEETNKRLVSFKEVIMPGISLWFTDYKQFAK